MSQRPLKVLHIVSALGMGGAETWLMEVLRHTSRSGGLRMDFLATSGERGVFDEEAERLGARIHYVPYGRAHLPSFIRRFRRLLADERYDAIHDHADYTSGWHFLTALGKLPAVRVTHVHSAWLHIEVSYGVSPLRRLTVRAGRALVRRLATSVCGTSRHVLNTYGFRKGSVLHCGIEVARFASPRSDDRASVLGEFGWPGDAKIVLFVGRLDQAAALDHPHNLKNSWFALNVVRAAASKDHAVRCLVAGAGEQALIELQSRVNSWGLERDIRLLGVRRDVPRLMRAADALLFPSRQEGLGMVAVEAQAAGLPVLASTAVPRECVVIPELYQALPLTESVERWAEAVLERMTTEKPAPDECRRALEASPFSIHESARRLESIYSSGLA